MKGNLGREKIIQKKKRNKEKLILPLIIWFDLWITARSIQITLKKKGEYVRQDSQYRNWISADSERFPPETGRYHLYVSFACPWAHRTLIVRKLKGLENVISVDVVGWFLGDGGWTLDPEAEGSTGDSVNGFMSLREVYLQTNPSYSGRITVPVLYDKVQRVIVNNESSEIIRMLNSEFNSLCATPEQAALDLYPESFRMEIDQLNSWIYPNVNNGVYRCGFATTQEAYDEAFDQLFESLDRLESILGEKR